MAYDVQPSKSYNPGENAFYVTLQSTDADEVKTLWDALSDGAAAILIPLAPAAFAPLYGMLTDRFDLTWIVGVDTPERASTTVYPLAVRSLASSSECSALSLPLTSALVWPLTFLRRRLPPASKPSEITPRQRPAQVL